MLIGDTPILLDHDRPLEIEAPPSGPDPPSPADRLLALVEVTLCSGYPTQLTLVPLLALVGASQTDVSGGLSLAFLVTLSLADAALVLGLVWFLLRVRGERPVATFLGVRPIGTEAMLGVLLVPAALLLAAVTFAVLLQIAPSLHNVADNPLEALIDTPAAAVAFAVVAVIAGGVREEVQRAFILRRFESHLGGPVVGLIVFSVAFGLGHLLQGRDAAVVTGLLGAFWGVVYLKRRSVVGPLVCHAGFNLTEVLIAYTVATGSGP